MIDLTPGTKDRLRTLFRSDYVPEAEQLHTYPGELKRAVILSAAVPTGEDNLAVPGKPVKTPVLLVRGETEPGDMNAYTAGFRAGGLQSLRTATLPGAGSSGPSEQSAALAPMLRQYIAATP